jgi:hypothetical protein
MEEKAAARIYNEIGGCTEYKANEYFELTKIAYKFWRALAAT